MLLVLLVLLLPLLLLMLLLLVLPLPLLLLLVLARVVQLVQVAELTVEQKKHIESVAALRPGPQA